MNEIDMLAKLLLAQRDTLYRSVVDHCADNLGDVSTEDVALLAGEVANEYTHLVTNELQQFGWQPPPQPAGQSTPQPADQPPPPQPADQPTPPPQPTDQP
jgi:hypothetical protein